MLVAVAAIEKNSTRPRMRFAMKISTVQFEIKMVGNKPLVPHNVCGYCIMMRMLAFNV